MDKIDFRFLLVLYSSSFIYQLSHHHHTTSTQACEHLKYVKTSLMRCSVCLLPGLSPAGVGDVVSDAKALKAAEQCDAEHKREVLRRKDQPCVIACVPHQYAPWELPMMGGEKGAVKQVSFFFSLLNKEMSILYSNYHAESFSVPFNTVSFFSLNNTVTTTGAQLELVPAEAAVGSVVWVAGGTRPGA